MSKAVVLRGEMTVPGDKSITHRSCMLGAVAHGVSRVVTNALGRDNLSCIRVLRQLGVKIEGTMTPEMLILAREEHLNHFGTSDDGLCHLEIFGQGFQALKPADSQLDCGNSGTFARLLTGLLAGSNFSSELTGDASLVTRPFKRVTEPLSLMGAKFSGDMLPLTVTGGELKGIVYDSPKASAQIKSAILFGALQAEGKTIVTEPLVSRDHTERMLSSMGVKLEEKSLADGRWQVTLVDCPEKLSPLDVTVPGDFSSAAFFLVAASIVPGSELRINNVGSNPTRTGLYNILRRMGAQIEVVNERLVAGEKVADYVVSSASLKGVLVDAKDVVLAIDEIPILSVAAALSSGVTEIHGAQELRVKETDRLAVMAQLLRSFSVEVEEYEDGMRVVGNPGLAELFANKSLRQPAVSESWRTSGDHRIAMSGAVLETRLFGEFEIYDTKAVETSFPGFSKYLQSVIKSNPN